MCHHHELEELALEDVEYDAEDEDEETPELDERPAVADD